MATVVRSSGHLTRREVLKQGSSALSAGLLLRRMDAAAPAQAHFPVAARARLSVTSYPFRAMLSSPANRGRNAAIAGMDLKEFPAFVVEKFGVHNINPLLDHFASTDQSYIEAFRAALDKAKSHIVDLGLSGKRFYAKDASIRQEAAAFGKKCIDVAVQVGSPSVRQHVSGHAGEKPDVTLAAGSLGEMAEYGAKKNVVINLENDSLVSEDPFFLVAVIEKVNNPYLRGLPDFGNSLITHDAAYNHRAVDAMLRHAFNMCHVKDTVKGDDGKIYHVDLASAFQLAKANSFRGYFSMEFDTGSDDPVAGTKRLVEQTLHYLG